MTNNVFDSENGTHYIIDTPEGRGLGGYSWVISEMDLYEHTPWERKDLVNLSEQEMEQVQFPRGVRGFFTT